MKFALRTFKYLFLIALIFVLSENYAWAGCSMVNGRMQCSVNSPPIATQSSKGINNGIAEGTEKLNGLKGNKAEDEAEAARRKQEIIEAEQALAADPNDKEAQAKKDKAEKALNEEDPKKKARGEETEGLLEDIKKLDSQIEEAESALSQLGNLEDSITSDDAGKQTEQSGGGQGGGQGGGEEKGGGEQGGGGSPPPGGDKGGDDGPDPRVEAAKEAAEQAKQQAESQMQQIEAAREKAKSDREALEQAAVERQQASQERMQEFQQQLADLYNTETEQVTSEPLEVGTTEPETSSVDTEFSQRLVQSSLTPEGPIPTQSSDTTQSTTANTQSSNGNSLLNALTGNPGRNSSNNNAVAGGPRTTPTIRSLTSGSNQSVLQASSSYGADTRGVSQRIYNTRSLSRTYRGSIRSDVQAAERISSYRTTQRNQSNRSLASLGSVPISLSMTSSVMPKELSRTMRANRSLIGGSATTPAKMPTKPTSASFTR